MGQMNVLCAQGDLTVEWRPEDRESVDKAKEEFKRLKEAGFVFYKPGKEPGERGAQVKRFAKTHERLIAVPGPASKADKVTGKRPKAARGGPRTQELPRARLRLP